MDTVGLTRRGWGRLALHCSRTLLALGALAALPALAQAPSVAGKGDSTNAATPKPNALPKVLVVGDSLSAEYGLARGSGWVALMEQRLARDKRAWQVVNASVSGETTSGGRSRLPALLTREKPQVVLIELGGNDALRGLPLTMTESNLQDMARAAKASGAQVVIAGIAVPPNYGRRYSEQLVALFGSVAKAEKAALVPFILAGVADAPNADELFQADRIHPKAQAQERMLNNVWPVLVPLLK